MTRALVLAGGGVAGIAWETGVLHGLAQTAPDLLASIMASDVIVGTSAGAAVGAQITSGRSLADLFEDQVSGPSPEIPVELDMAHLVDLFTRTVTGAGSRLEMRRRIGQMATETSTVSERDRRAVIERRLPCHEWPDRDVRFVAVDAGTGERVVFDRRSGVPMVDAVAASCAVPGVWPPVSINGRRFIDGGVYSSANLDVAAGADVALVVTPDGPEDPGLAGTRLIDEAEKLVGTRVEFIAADPDALAAFGTNPLAASTRKPAAEAGCRQGRAAAEHLRSVW